MACKRTCKLTLILFETVSPSLDKWSPALQIRTVLLSIQALLSAPNPDDPLANDVAEQWKINEAEAIQKGKVMLLLSPRLTLQTVKKHQFLKYDADIEHRFIKSKEH